MVLVLVRLVLVVREGVARHDVGTVVLVRLVRQVVVVGVMLVGTVVVVGGRGW